MLFGRNPLVWERGLPLLLSELTSYCGPGTMQGTEDTTVRKTQSCPLRACRQVGEIDLKQVFIILCINCYKRNIQNLGP